MEGERWILFFLSGENATYEVFRGILEGFSGRLLHAPPPSAHTNLMYDHTAVEYRCTELTQMFIIITIQKTQVFFHIFIILAYTIAV